MSNSKPALYVQINKPKRADIIKRKIEIIGRCGRLMDAALEMRSPTEKYYKLRAIQKRYESYSMLWAAAMVERLAEDAYRVISHVERDPFHAKKNRKQICYACNLEKPIAEFQKRSNKSGQYFGKCKKCMKDGAKKYAKKYAEK